MLALKAVASTKRDAQIINVGKPFFSIAKSYLQEKNQATAIGIKSELSHRKHGIVLFVAYVNITTTVFFIATLFYSSILYDNDYNNMWKIKFLAIVEKELDSLTNEQLKSIAKEIKLLELCGNSLKLPHSKALGNGLFELRERKFGFRIYYTFLNNQIIILLRAGNKATQDKDIKIARNYLAKLQFQDQS